MNTGGNNSEFAKFPELNDAFSLRRWLWLNVVLLVLTGLISLSFPVSSLSRRLGDSYFRIRGIQPMSKSVALVLIDDAALDQYGRWPWPRERVAQLVRAVGSQHPQAIGIDILVSEKEDAANDRALASAIEQAGNVILPSKISGTSGSSERGLWTDPQPEFAKVAAATGHAQAAPDSDGVCRRIPLFEPSAEGPRPAFALAITRVARPDKAQAWAAEEIKGPGFTTFEPSYLTIDYLQQFSSAESVAPFATISARDLLAGKPGTALQGKIVLIGFGATELSDRLFTPVSTQAPMPGVEVNANAVNTLVEHRQIESAGLLPQLLLLICSGMVLLWLVRRFPGRQGLLFLAVVMLGEYVAGYFAFTLLHRQFEYGVFLVAGILAAPLAQLENLFVVERAITLRLKQLEGLLLIPSANAATAQDKVIVPRRGRSQSRLHWKLGALHRLENELTSLYTFNRTLLEGMREVLAVYNRVGQPLFHNSSWKQFCEQQDLETAAGFDEVLSLLDLGNDLAQLSMESGSWLEKELFLRKNEETSWRFRVVRLPWPSVAEPNAIMLLGEDISARRERDQARAEAIGFVTHELRTPLIAIQGFAELMMRYPQQIATSDAPTTIFRESRRLVAMINAYLEVLRMDVGSRPLRVKPVEIGAMVRHVEQILQPLAQSAQIEIRTEIGAEAQTLNCDELLVTGALLNLVSNAVKYSPRGSVVELEALVIDRNQNQAVEFQVRNRGPIIPQESLARVFEPYYRVPDQPGEKPGWGLGLAFVKRISEQHGGRVEVSSDSSTGTCFRLVLPLYADIASEATV